MSELKLKVIELLKSYPHRKRKIGQLKFELEHLTLIGGDELIGGLSLGSQAYGSGNPKGGYISNKTMMIALQYQDMTQRLNTETVIQITQELQALEVEVERLERYLSLLEPRQANILRLYYIEGRTWPELVQELYLSRRSLQNLRDQGVDELASMYQLITDINGNKDDGTG